MYDVGLVSVPYIGLGPGMSLVVGISGHVRRGTSECALYWAGTSWDVPGSGDLRTCKTWD